MLRLLLRLEDNGLTVDKNYLPTLTKVEASLGPDTNCSEAKIDCPKSYASVIGMMLYLDSNTIPDISFYVHQCARFTHNTKSSHNTSVKRMCRHLLGTKDNGLVFNPYKEIVVGCYADEDFSGLWEHVNSQDPICARSRTGFVVTFSNFTLLCLSKIQKYISLSTLHSGYVILSNYVRALLPLKSLIKESIDNLVIDSDNLKLVSRSTVYE